MFEFDDQRIEGVEAELRHTGARASSLKPVITVIVDKVLEREERMFETRGATSGVYWTPLRGSTVRRKGHEEPLIDTGSLMRSLSERGAQYQELEEDDDGFRLATTHPAAEYHAEGTSNMPARPPLIIPAKHAREYVGMISDYIFGMGV